MNDISNLSTLLAESRLAQDAGSSAYTQPPITTSATSVVTSSSKSHTNNSELKVNVECCKNIWSPDEILTEDKLVDWKDDRPAPRFEFSYKQLVGTEDTVLGMGNRTPLTFDCSHLVVKVHFPKSTMKDLDLNVTKNRIKAASRFHHLYTYFPVNVDADNGSAKFDTVKEVLTVTLPIVQEY